MTRLVRKAPLIAFFCLAFGMSWLIWSPLVLGRMQRSPEAVVLITAGAFGPALSALVVARISGGREAMRAWARRIASWRVAPVWYAAALLVPGAAALASIGLFILAGGVLPKDWTSPPWFAYPIAFVYVLLLGGGQEEPGWRGFALDRLLVRTDGFRASLLLGLIWAAWHIPLFFAPASAQFGLPFLWYVLHTVAVAIIFTWLYRSVGRSILLVMMLHAGLNAVAAWLPIAAEGGRLTMLEALLLVEWLLVGCLLMMYGRELARADDESLAIPDLRQRQLSSR